MGQSKLEIRTILDDVVHQFSSPLAFVRELIQNSIDAGTGEVEVELSHDGQEDQAMAVISFRDWGVGMNQEIIDSRLLRLFSSGKDDDLTKIGRFGIGFVSVFAIEPEAVVIDTGREGQYWRILFSKDRSYELFALENPIEGTMVRIYKPMDLNAYGEFQREIDHALRKWCKYAEIPIRLDGKDIRQDIEVPSALSMTYQEEGTQIRIGFSGREQALSGYYNRGLTLKESVRSPWAWVCFKIDSRYLEHTLTRDQVLEDRHFSKAMKLLENLAEDTLPERLIDEIEALASEPGRRENLDVYYRYLAHYMSCDRPFWRSWRSRDIFQGSGGKTFSFRQVRRAYRRETLRLTQLDGAPAEAFDSENILLVMGRDGLRQLIEELFAEAPRYIEDENLLLAALRCKNDRNVEVLRQAVVGLFADGDRQVDEVLMVSASELPKSMRDRAAVVVPTVSGIIDRTLWRRPDCNDFTDCLGPGFTLVVNADSPLVEPFIELASAEPEWAAVALIESLFVIGDGRIWSRAVNERAKRQEKRGKHASR